jgi:mono/diheme cytochrome c family protein
MLRRRLLDLNQDGSLRHVPSKSQIGAFMARNKWIHIVLAIAFGLLGLLIVRQHLASGEDAPTGKGGNAEQGRYLAQAWCTECHSVQLETAGTGKFAPDFTVIAQRRSAHWLNIFLRSEHKIMPEFVFTPRQADDIVTYILSLKRASDVRP